jgi:hypothetical protein
MRWGEYNEAMLTGREERGRDQLQAGRSDALQRGSVVRYRMSSATKGRIESNSSNHLLLSRARPGYVQGVVRHHLYPYEPSGDPT